MTSLTYNFSNKFTLHFWIWGMKEKSLSAVDTSILTSPETYPSPDSTTLTSWRVPFTKIGVKMHPIPELDIISKSGIDV